MVDQGPVDDAGRVGARYSESELEAMSERSTSSSGLRIGQGGKSIFGFNLDKNLPTLEDKDPDYESHWDPKLFESYPIPQIQKLYIENKWF